MNPRLVVLGLFALSSLGSCTSAPSNVSESTRELWSVLEEYDKMPPDKALAIADNGARWVFGYSYWATTPANAEAVALEQCRVSAHQYSVATPCRLYALQDEVIWQLSDELELFKRYDLHKAFWVADVQGALHYGSVGGLQSASHASRAALEECESTLTGEGTAALCFVCAVDGENNCPNE